MTKRNELKSFLKENPGYLKWGNERLSVFLNASVSIISAIKNEISAETIFLKKATKHGVIRPYTKGKRENTIIIGDPHEPFTLEQYKYFIRYVQEKYECGSVVNIGDMVDNHAVSYHEKDPEGKSAGDEFNLALAKCKEWYNLFPEAKVCIGNHDALPFRKAFTAGLPQRWLKSYQELLESPKEWEWDFTHEICDVIYQHGTGMSGEMAAINAARENRKSTVIGHLHTVSNIRFLASYKDLIFGMNVGCGIDHNQYAFAYGKQNTRKPVISCGVVIEGKLPILIPMDFTVDYYSLLINNK